MTAQPEMQKAVGRLYRAARTQYKSDSRPGEHASEGEWHVRQYSVIPNLKDNAVKLGVPPADSDHIIEIATNRALDELHGRRK